MMLGGKEGGMLKSRTIPTAMRGGISASHPDLATPLAKRSRRYAGASRY